MQQSKRAVGHNDVYGYDDAVDAVYKDVQRTWRQAYESAKLSLKNVQNTASCRSSVRLLQIHLIISRLFWTEITLG